MLDHSLGEFQVTSHGDTAVVTYLSVFRYKDPSGNIVGPVTYRQTSVWQQQKSGWVLIANAAAEVKQ
jgi:ketosteroid isomerase-like protein